MQVGDETVNSKVKVTCGKKEPESSITISEDKPA